MTIIKTESCPIVIAGQEIGKVEEVQITNIAIRELDGWAQVYLNFRDSNNKLLVSMDMKITGDDYSNWGTDDQYLIGLILSEYNLTEK